MRHRKTAPLIAAWIGACLAGPAAAQPTPGETEDARELVFDFRPRIVMPGAAADPGPPQSPSRERDVHLHVFEQTSGAQACNGSLRAPLDGPHVGVVLSGGISKGLAFIGALDVIDRVGIRVDKIAGTSMGAVIGAFYAAGYSPTLLYTPEDKRTAGSHRQADILSGINWRTLFTDVPDTRSLTLNQQISWGLGEGSTALPRVYQNGLRSGQNLSSFLGKYLLAASAASDGCFDNLYVPFIAKATNVSASTSATLQDGDLATAVRASLSFPALLTPTFINGSRYIDGGILNNYALDAIVDPSAKAAPGPTKPAAPSAPFGVILGFDVSDTTVPLLPQPTLIPGKSLLGAIAGIDDAIGAAISRETKRQIDTHDACGDVPPEARAGPCLLNFKFNSTGGFTDFEQTQIDEFVRNGRLQVIQGLCLKFVAASDPACAAAGAARDGRTWNQRPAKDRADVEDAAIRRIRTSIKTGAWSFLLHDPRRTLNRAKDDARLNHGLLPRLRVLADALEREGAAQPARLRAAEARWPGVLQGLQLTLDGTDQLHLEASATPQQDEALRRKLIGDIRRTVAWLVRELAQPACNEQLCALAATADLPDFGNLAGIRVTRRGDTIAVRASTWNYRIEGLIASNGLTERATLGRATVDFWNVTPGAADERVRKLDDTFCRRARPGSTDCLPNSLQKDSLAAADGTSISYTLTNEEQAKAALPTARWKREIFQALDRQLLDVRYRAGQDPACDREPADAAPGRQPSLPYLFECLQERYYSNAAAEFFRISAITPATLEIAEKDTSRTALGSLFGSYQYDFNNKHTFGLKHVYETHKDAWYKPTRVISSLAANEPLAEIAGMRLLDLKILYYPSIQPLAADYSVNPYIARRNQRIGEAIPNFLYRDTGLNVTASWRPAMAIGRTANYWTPYVGASTRRLGRVRTGDIEQLRGLLHDDGLGDGERVFRSLSAGGRAVQYRERASLVEQVHVALHQGNASSYREYSLDLSAEAAVGAGADADLVGLRIFMGVLQHPGRSGAEDPAHAPPMDELYSLGGYFPLAERNLWGRKRIDYLGTEINGRWGTRLALLEGRYSLWRWSPVSYFAPYARVQLDAVVQSAQIGFRSDPSRRWRMASGFVGSVYFPSVASVKARLSAAIGGESLKGVRFFSSGEILF
jgi:predicted acylesterase/phospholipase RssA